MASNSFLGDIAYETMIRGQVGMDYQQRVRNLENQLEDSQRSASTNGILMADMIQRMNEQELEERERRKHEQARAEKEAAARASAQASVEMEHERAETWRQHYNDERDKVDAMLKERIAGAEHATVRYRQGKAKVREMKISADQTQRDMSDAIARKENRIDELGDTVCSMRRDLRATKDSLAEMRGLSSVYQRPPAVDEYAEARDALVRVKRHADSYEQLSTQNMPDWVAEEYAWCLQHDELVEHSPYQAGDQSAFDAQRDDMYTALGEAAAHSNRIEDEQKRSVMDAAIGRARDSLADMDRRLGDVRAQARVHREDIG